MSTKMKKMLVVLTTVPIIIGMILLFLPGLAFGEAHDHSENWDGRGKDSEDCTKAGDGPRDAEEGWIHWIFSTKGSSTNAWLTLGGSGSGTYDPYGSPAEVYHFFTPYSDLETLSATIYIVGEPGPGGGLVISDFCPGDPGEEPEIGCIVIIKETEGLLPDDEVTFGFTVYDSEVGGSVVATQDISIDFSTDTTGSATICDEDFVPGTTYWVEETDDAGWVNITPGRQAVVAVEQGGTYNSVTFINDPSEESGDGDGDGTTGDGDGDGDGTAGDGDGDITTTTSPPPPGEVEVEGIIEVLPMTGSNLMLMIFGIILIVIGVAFGGFYLQKSMKRR